MRRRLATGLIGLAAVAAPLLPTNPAAAASTYVHANSSSYVNVRTCPTTTYSRYCYQLASLANNTPVSMYCWIDGAWANGNYWTNRWFVVRSSAIPGGKGFVHASLVINQTAVGKCQGTDIRYV